MHTSVLGGLCLLTWLTLGCAAAHPPLAQSTSLAENATETPGQVRSLINPAGPLLPGTPVQPTLTPQAFPDQPGQAPGGLPLPNKPPASPASQNPDAGDWQTYTDSRAHFSISYPPYLVARPLTAAELARLEPAPVAATFFEDQRNHSAALAPPALSIRVFQNSQQLALADWLVAVGLFKPDADWTTEPYQGQFVAGLKVMTPTFMSPGWFVYVARRNEVWQLTPLGSAAEQMLNTFKFTD